MNQGATAEFGRSAGGFVNVITKSGTNDLSGSAHYFWPVGRDGGAVSGGARRREARLRTQPGRRHARRPPRARPGLLLPRLRPAGSGRDQAGGPARREPGEPGAARQLPCRTRWPGLFDDEFGPIRRTDDARSLLAKLDLNLDGRHQASFKYNTTWAEQVNGTFDVDAWGASMNGIEGDESHAFNGSLRSLLTNALSNELRIQWAREDRPRWYEGPLLPGARTAGPAAVRPAGRPPVPPTSRWISPTGSASASRSFSRSIRRSTRGCRWSTTCRSPPATTCSRRGWSTTGPASSSSSSDWRTDATYSTRSTASSASSPRATASSPARTGRPAPSASVRRAPASPGRSFSTCSRRPCPASLPDQLGLQAFQVHEWGAFLQDTWHPHDRVTLDLGLRWEGTWHPGDVRRAGGHLLRAVPR